MSSGCTNVQFLIVCQHAFNTKGISLNVVSGGEHVRACVCTRLVLFFLSPMRSLPCSTVLLRKGKIIDYTASGVHTEELIGRFDLRRPCTGDDHECVELDPFIFLSALLVRR